MHYGFRKKTHHALHSLYREGKRYLYRQAARYASRAIQAGSSYVTKRAATYAKNTLEHYFKKKQKTHHRHDVSTQTNTRTLSQGTQTGGMQSISQHNDLSTDRLSIALRPPQKLFKKLGKWTYRWTGTGSSTFIDLIGMQSNILINCFLPLSWSHDDAVTGLQPYSLNQNLFSLNPYQQVPTNTILYPNPDPNQPSINQAPVNDYVHVHDIDCTYLIQNMSSVATYCELVFYTPKTNLGPLQHPLAVWKDTLDLKGLGQNNETLAPSLAGLTNVFPGNPYDNGVSQDANFKTYGLSTFYPSYPESEKQFKQSYRTLRKKRFILQGGDTRKISLKIMVNTTLGRNYATQMVDNGQQFTAGKSIFAMLISRPTLVDLQNEAGFVPATGKAKLGWNYMCKMNLSSLGSSRLEYNRTVHGTIVNPGAGWVPHQMNDVDKNTQTEEA